MMSQPSLTIVVTGPGGAGKGTITSRILANDARLWLSRSWTTRPYRANEAKDAYNFVTRDAFEAAIEEGGFLEYDEHLGNLYGTPWPSPPQDRDVVLEIDVMGTKWVRKRTPDCCVFLITPPSHEVQEARLRKRGDSEESVQSRLERAALELELGKLLADHIIVNDDLDHAVAQVEAAIAARRAASTNLA